MIKRIIKKYPNRRLYDTALGRYITLEDVRGYVLERIPFQVIDAKTHKELTQSTLLQIISEQESSTSPLFTTSLLEDLIRSYHQKSQVFVKEYLEKAMSLFLQQKSLLDKQWEHLHKLTQHPLSTFQKSNKKAKTTAKAPPKKKSKYNY